MCSLKLIVYDANAIYQLALYAALFTRRIIANKVSMNGTAKITIGKNNAIIVIFLNPSKERNPMINPIIKAPLSPKNILAGWKL